MKQIEIRTVQTNAMKQLFEALKDILTDVNIEFSEIGIKIAALDSTKTVYVHLRLKSEKFDKYLCTKKTIIGLSMSNLFKLLKTINNDDTLTFMMDDENTNKLTIILENSEKNKITEYDLNLMDLNEEEISVPDQVFDSIFTMPSNEFQKICRDMNNLSDEIEIKNIGTQLIFSCKGEFANQKTIIGHTENGLNFVETNNNKSDPIIQGYYNLKHLVLFTKCTNLCSSVEIFMKNNFPIVITYSVGNLGKLKFALAPKISS